jgi:hypothetical protein
MPIILLSILDGTMAASSQFRRFFYLPFSQSSGAAFPEVAAGMKEEWPL